LSGKGFQSGVSFDVAPSASLEGGVMIGQGYTGFYFGGGVGKGAIPIVASAFLTDTVPLF